MGRLVCTLTSALYKQRRPPPTASNCRDNGEQAGQAKIRAKKTKSEHCN